VLPGIISNGSTAVAVVDLCTADAVVLDVTGSNVPQISKLDSPAIREGLVKAGNLAKRHSELQQQLRGATSRAKTPVLGSVAFSAEGRLYTFALPYDRLKGLSLAAFDANSKLIWSSSCALPQVPGLVPIHLAVVGKAIFLAWGPGTVVACPAYN
jgi:hypothetical protein